MNIHFFLIVHCNADVFIVKLLILVFRVLFIYLFGQHSKDFNNNHLLVISHKNNYRLIDISHNFTISLKQNYVISIYVL